MEKINVIIVSDSKAMVEELQNVLKQDEEIDVEGIASPDDEGIALVQAVSPDVVLMGIRTEAFSSGISSAEQIHDSCPEIKEIIFTDSEKDELLFSAYAAGARDYILEAEPSDSIIRSIKDVQGNQLLMKPAFAEKIRKEFNRYINLRKRFPEILYVLARLTGSEMDVLRASFNGKSTRQIAEERFVIQQTVKTQVNSILKKFGMKRMKEVIEALRLIHFEDIMDQF